MYDAELVEYRYLIVVFFFALLVYVVRGTVRLLLSGRSRTQSDVQPTIFTSNFVWVGIIVILVVSLFSSVMIFGDPIVLEKLRRGEFVQAANQVIDFVYLTILRSL